MAVHAGRRPRVAAQERGAVNAVLVGGDEGGARRNLVAHRLVLDVTGEAETLLPPLQRCQVEARARGDPGLVAAEAGRSGRSPARQGLSVLRSEKVRLDVVVATA